MLYRYSTDAKWHVPHFEKMLYDQGQLCSAYAAAFRASGETKFSKVAEDIAEYVLRDLRHPKGESQCRNYANKDLIVIFFFFSFDFFRFPNYLDFAN